MFFLRRFFFQGAIHPDHWCWRAHRDQTSTHPTVPQNPIAQFADSLGLGHTETVFFTLIEWFARDGRPLPWREPGCSPWAILVCEVMSQQTPVSRVLPRWNMWMERWPEPSDLAAAAPAEVLVAWDKLKAIRAVRCACANARW